MTTATEPKEPKELEQKDWPHDWSPWGPPQDWQEYAEGVYQVGTAGHGGVKLDRKRNALVPAYMRLPGGWYEEDCDWCIPAIVFPESGLDRGSAKETLLNWHPDAYAKFYDVPLENLEGESTVYDERLWKKANADKMQTLAAWGDWHKNVPEGMVGVCACIGGRTDSPPYHYANEQKYFLVPEADYKARQGPYIVPEDAEEWKGPN